MLYVELANGDSFDNPVAGDVLDDELLDWSHGRFALAGEVLQMRWLDQVQARETAPRIFGVTWCLDNYDRVIWSWSDK